MPNSFCTCSLSNDTRLKPRQRPERSSERAARLAGPRRGQDQEPEAEFRRFACARRLHRFERRRDFGVRQRPEVLLDGWHSRQRTVDPFPRDVLRHMTVRPAPAQHGAHPLAHGRAVSGRCVHIGVSTRNASSRRMRSTFTLPMTGSAWRSRVAIQSFACSRFRQRGRSANRTSVNTACTEGRRFGPALRGERIAPERASRRFSNVALRATVPTGGRRSLASAPLALFDARRDGSHPAVWRFPCRPPTAGCADRRSAFPCQRAIRLVVVRTCQSGGGGGNRTRVRKSSATTSTCISGLWAGTRARRRLSLFRSRTASTRRIAARNLSLVLTDGSGRPPAKPA